MDLVDIKDGAFLGSDTLHHRLEALLEITTKLRAGDERPHVQLIDLGTSQRLGHVAVDDALCQAIDDTGLAHTRFTDVQRVVLVLAAQHLDGAVQFSLTPDERVVVAYMIVDAQHIVAPSTRGRSIRCLALLGIITAICIINGLLRITVVVQCRHEDANILLVHQRMQTVGCKGVFQFHHHVQQVGHIGDINAGAGTLELQSLHEHVILIGIHYLDIRFIVRNVLHAGYALPQFLDDGGKLVLGGDFIHGCYHLAVVERHQQHVLRRNQCIPVHAGESHCIIEQRTEMIR